MTNLPRMTLADLEGLTGASYSSEHVCEKSPNPDAIFLVHCTSFDEQTLNEWQLIHFWLSTQEQVDAGEYIAVGQVVASNGFAIGWCPFCGKKL